MTEEVQVVEGQVEDTPQSVVLTDTEVQDTIEGKETDIVLPSDEGDFTMPEKFEGKSAEEIAKAYLELEKMKQKEEPKQEEPEDKSKNDELDMDKYYDSYLENDGFTEQDYKDFEEKGLSKEQVDERVEFIKYKIEKAQNELLEGIGTIDEFNKAAVKARETWGEEKTEIFNQDLAKANPATQKLLVKAMMDEFSDKGESTTDEPIHSSTPQAQPKKGYSSRAELLDDMSNPAYESDKAFNKAVEAKLAISDTSKW